MALRTRAEPIDAGEVPVIDVAPLRDGTDPAGVGVELARAATEVGFLYVRNHGVGVALVERARRAALEFFRLPEEAKREAGTNRFHHGYLKPGSTQMYDDARLDLKESFNWGVELDGEAGGEPAAKLGGGPGVGSDGARGVVRGAESNAGSAAGPDAGSDDVHAVAPGAGSNGTPAAGCGAGSDDEPVGGPAGGSGGGPGGEGPSANPLLGPNVWPAAMPALKPAVYPCFEAASACAEDLLRGFALGAGLDAEHFIRLRDRPLSRGSLQYYPPQPDDAAEDQFGVAPHTDFGVLTVLCQDEIGGLEIQRRNGSWAAMPPIPGTLVVNIGDLLERWSNRRYRSTVHRVINASGRERLSLVLAYDPNFETLVDPRAFCAEGETPHDAPITCGDYLLWRFAKAFSYRR